ncbi:hypothetical protein [Myceligenerans indicum]|uniref:Uncharacterized protein n=1 Tax=Myceligenerans indicum TaxID=2593663 RepID=A0ABS1LHK0_9MICO|nr:hypothetical protein [Myceligenerans indicum]MBL0885047.1 hypothetical protein [Myceligenerans indicum]
MWIELSDIAPWDQESQRAVTDIGWREIDDVGLMPEEYLYARSADGIEVELFVTELAGGSTAASIEVEGQRGASSHE